MILDFKICAYGGDRLKKYFSLNDSIEVFYFIKRLKAFDFYKLAVDFIATFILNIQNF